MGMKIQCTSVSKEQKCFLDSKSQNALQLKHRIISGKAMQLSFPFFFVNLLF